MKKEKSSTVAPEEMFPEPQEQNLVIPSDKKELAEPPHQARGFENGDDNSDLLYPRVKLLQALSPEVQDKSSKLEAGQIVNSITKEPLVHVFIPVLKFKNWIRFKDRGEGGGVLWSSTNANDTRVLKESVWGPNGEKPLATAYLNFVCLFTNGTDLSDPIILSFFNTSYKSGKKLLSLAKFSNKDMFSHYYKLNPKKVENQKGSFFVLDVEQLEEVKEGHFKHAENVFLSSAQVKSQIVVDDVTENKDDQEQELL